MTQTYRTYSSTFLSEKLSEDECHPLPLWEVPWSPPGLLFLVGKKNPSLSFFFFQRNHLLGNWVPSVHTCPPYTLGVSGDFCIRSPEWKFLYTPCIRIRVDTRIRIFLYTLTSQYQNQSFSARDLTNPLRCPDTNRIRVDGRIRFVYATCGRRYFCIRIKKIADTKISGYVWTGAKYINKFAGRFDTR